MAEVESASELVESKAVESVAGLIAASVEPTEKNKSEIN
jgi:hypothetical protein